MNELAPAELRARLLDPGVIAVIRMSNPEQTLPVAEALLEGGIIAIELTATIPRALELVRAAVKQLGDNALIGLGSVVDSAMAQEAVEAGASFVVTPVTRPEVVPVVHRAGRLAILGAYTPTEAQLAHEVGADFVKIFPADHLGPNYIRALRGPLPHLQLIPTGGVTLLNMAEFFHAGCAAVGVGSALTPPELVGKREALVQLAGRYVQVARTIRQAGR